MSMIVLIHLAALYKKIKFNLTKILKEILLNISSRFREPSKSIFLINLEANNWIRNAVTGYRISNASLSLLDREKLTDSSKDNSLKSVFADHSLIDFWFYNRRKGHKYFITFVHNVSVRENNFQHTLLSKITREKINAESNLRLTLSDIEWNFKFLCFTKQSQISHGVFI